MPSKYSRGKAVQEKSLLLQSYCLFFQILFITVKLYWMPLNIVGNRQQSSCIVTLRATRNGYLNIEKYFCRTAFVTASV